MNEQTTVLTYQKGIRAIIINKQLYIGYDTETLMQLTEAEQNEIEKNIKSDLIINGIIEQ